MKQLDEQMQTEVVDLFRGIYTSDEQVEELKESIKVFNASKKEMIVNTAEKLEVKPLHLRKAYKQWLNSIQKPEEVQEVDGIVAFILEFVADKIEE
jgi:cbb3-type cytochrome oxidase cytochrome c subunit